MVFAIPEESTRERPPRATVAIGVISVRFG